MKYLKDYTEVYKFRTTALQSEALKEYAKNNDCSISEAIRDLLFSEPTDLVFRIQKELIKQRVYNLLQNTKMPEQTRKTLIEEVSKID